PVLHRWSIILGDKEWPLAYRNAARERYSQRRRDLVDRRLHPPPASCRKPARAACVQRRSLRVSQSVGSPQSLSGCLTEPRATGAGRRDYQSVAICRLRIEKPLVNWGRASPCEFGGVPLA